jgi:hypothetical protein
MAEAVVTWPIEAIAVAGPDAPEAAPVGDPPRPTPPELDERTLWQTPEARVTLRRDPRTAREIIVETRAAPLEGEALAALRRRAALGGPHVQRVLRLSDDRREIWYEALDGEPLPLGALADDERARLAPVIAALAVTERARFVRLPTGPVLIVTPAEP